MARLLTRLQQLACAAIPHIPADGWQSPARLPASSVRAPLPLEVRDPCLGLPSVFPKMQVVHRAPAPAPHPRHLGPNPCHPRPLQSKARPVRAQQVAGSTQHPGEGRACLPAADRGTPSRSPPPNKGKSETVTERKKAQAWPEAKRRSSGKPLVPCEHSFSGKQGLCPLITCPAPQHRPAECLRAFASFCPISSVLLLISS